MSSTGTFLKTTTDATHTSISHTARREEAAVWAPKDCSGDAERAAAQREYTLIREGGGACRGECMNVFIKRDERYAMPAESARA